MQQAEEAAGDHGALQGIEVEGHPEEEVAEGDPAQQRRQRAPQGERDIPGLAPARPGKLVAECEAHGPQDECDQQQEHRQVQPRERGGVEQGPGGEGRAAAEDEPDLVALPHRLDPGQQRTPLGIGAAREAEGGPDPQVEPVHDRKAGQQHPQDQPPQHAQRRVVGRVPLMCAARAAASSPGPRVRAGWCAP